ncbi:MAG: ATP synthase F1 subunit gamma [Lachnospiraceae bacterium]|nr:ATP synthase F1 subunit gamma [Lachnospiraceae bacterium]
MASMRDIKRRKESIQSTGQITKAMKLVSTVKLQKAKESAENTKPYFDCMYETLSQVLSKMDNVSHPYITPSATTKKGVICITSNKGLAGGYNSNIIKLVTGMDVLKEDLLIYAVGRKGKDGLARKGYHIEQNYSEVMNNVLYSDAMAIGRQVIQDFTEGKIGEIYLAYTEFKNTVVHIPKLIKLLPFSETDTEEIKEKTVADLTVMEFEPDEEEALNLIIPKYVNSLIYGGLVASFASENGARMQAMDSATSNAETMIEELGLKYNRARQAAITQEITEIVGGAAAING